MVAIGNFWIFAFTWVNIVHSFFFCILMNFYFVTYYIFLHTDLWKRRKNTKNGKEN